MSFRARNYHHVMVIQDHYSRIYFNKWVSWNWNEIVRQVFQFNEFIIIIIKFYYTTLYEQTIQQWWVIKLSWNDLKTNRIISSFK